MSAALNLNKKHAKRRIEKKKDIDLIDSLCKAIPRNISADKINLEQLSGLETKKPPITRCSKRPKSTSTFHKISLVGFTVGFEEHDGCVYILYGRVCPQEEGHGLIVIKPLESRITYFRAYGASCGSQNTIREAVD